MWVCMCVRLSYTDTLVFTCVPTYARIFTITYQRNMLRLNRIENDEMKLTSRLVAKRQWGKFKEIICRRKRRSFVIIFGHMVSGNSIINSDFFSDFS